MESAGYSAIHHLLNWNRIQNQHILPLRVLFRIVFKFLSWVFHAKMSRMYLAIFIAIVVMVGLIDARKFLSSFFIYIFLLFFRTHILLPLVLLFLISGDFSSGFQNRNGPSYPHCSGKCDVCSLRFKAGAKPTDLLMANWLLAQIPIGIYHLCLQGIRAGFFKNLFVTGYHSFYEALKPLFQNSGDSSSGFQVTY